ncbi:AAA domain-containing protein [Sphingomonas sp. BK036]|nr:AAA domain-containing protein [Sphingomonas sp. BK036]
MLVGNDLVKLIAQAMGPDAVNDLYADLTDVADEALSAFNYQVMVPEEYVDALRDAERHAATILGRARIKPTLAELAESIARAEPLIDSGEARDIAERAINRSQRKSDVANVSKGPVADPIDSATPIAVGRPPLDLSDPAAWLNPPKHLFGTLAHTDFDPAAETAPPTWLAKGLLPRVGIGLLFGESGAGKSFAAVHAALSIAWGLPLFGSKTKTGGVLYIAAEGGTSVNRRLAAADRAMATAVASANANRSAGSAPLSRAPIRVVHETPDLSRDGKADPLIRTIKQAEADFAAAGVRLALVIVDTWHAAMGGGDENSAADAGHALKPLIAESERGGFLTLIVHHPGKDVDRGSRGSNALPAAADAIIAVTVPGYGGPVAKPASAVRRATVTKMRDGDAGMTFDYNLTVVPMGIDEDGETVSTCVVEPVESPKLVGEIAKVSTRHFMEALREAVAGGGGSRATTGEVKLRFYSKRGDASKDAKKRAWERALEEALGEGLAESDEHELALWLPR